MGELHLPVRPDLAESGGFRFNNHGVSHDDDGHEMLRRFIPITRADLLKKDFTGSSTYLRDYEAATSRIYDQINADVLAGGAGSYKMYLEIQLEREFGRRAPSPLDGTTDADLGYFPTDALGLFTYRTGDITDLLLTLEKAGSADSVLNGVSVKPSAANTWEFFPLTPGDQYNPGDFVTLILEYVASTVNVKIRGSRYSLGYMTARGNV